MIELDICFCIFCRHIRLLRPNKFYEFGVPLDVNKFNAIFRAEIDEAIEHLQNVWYADIVSIFKQTSGSKKRVLFPPITDPKLGQKYFNCVASLMSYQLQSICIESLKEYVTWALDVGVVNIYQLAISSLFYACLIEVNFFFQLISILKVV